MSATADQVVLEKERAKSIQGISSCKAHSPDKMSKRNSAASQDKENAVKDDWEPHPRSPIRAARPDECEDYLDSSGHKNKRLMLSPKMDVANEAAAAS